MMYKRRSIREICSEEIKRIAVIGGRRIGGSKLGMLDVFDLVFNTLGAVAGWKLSRVINST